MLRSLVGSEMCIRDRSFAMASSLALSPSKSTKNSFHGPGPPPVLVLPAAAPPGIPGAAHAATSSLTFCAIETVLIGFAPTLETQNSQSSLVLTPRTSSRPRPRVQCNESDILDGLEKLELVKDNCADKLCCSKMSHKHSNCQNPNYPKHKVHSMTVA